MKCSIGPLRFKERMKLGGLPCNDNHPIKCKCMKRIGLFVHLSACLPDSSIDVNKKITHCGIFLNPFAAGILSLGIE